MFIIACKKKKREKANNFIKQSSLSPILAILEISKPTVHPIVQQPLNELCQRGKRRLVFIERAREGNTLRGKEPYYPSLPS